MRLYNEEMAERERKRKAHWSNEERRVEKRKTKKKKGEEEGKRHSVV